MRTMDEDAVFKKLLLEGVEQVYDRLKTGSHPQTLGSASLQDAEFRAIQSIIDSKTSSDTEDNAVGMCICS